MMNKNKTETVTCFWQTIQISPHMKTLKAVFFFNQAFACMHLNVQICVHASISSFTEPTLKLNHKLKTPLCITVSTESPVHIFRCCQLYSWHNSSFLIMRRALLWCAVNKDQLISPVPPDCICVNNLWLKLNRKLYWNCLLKHYLNRYYLHNNVILIEKCKNINKTYFF